MNPDITSRHALAAIVLLPEVLMSLLSRPVAPPSVPLPRQAYTAPRLTPLGAWTAITLVTSIPQGPGSGVFNPNAIRDLV